MLNTKYERYLRKKNALIDQIVELRRRATKHKALLSLKYETLLIRINLIQVSVIFFATISTLLISLKDILNLGEIIWDIIPILISTYITLIMAVLRFFKWESQKENISKCHENHTYIINKLEKMYNIIINFEWIDDESSREKWGNIISTFEDELFDNFVSAKETFDTILSYKDVIYYKEKYKKLYLKMEFCNQDIELIRRGNNMEHKNYMKKNAWYLRWFCCYPEESVNMNHFLQDSYNKFGTIIDHDSMISSSSASSYEQYDRDHQSQKDSMIDEGNLSENKRDHIASLSDSFNSMEENKENTPLLEDISTVVTNSDEVLNTSIVEDSVRDRDDNINSLKKLFSPTDETN